MKIINNKSGEYGDVINSYYNLERFDEKNEDEVLFVGYTTSIDANLKEIHKEFKKRAYLNLEAPCAFASTTTCMEEQDYFTHVYTLCPYVCEYANARENKDTRYYQIPFPFDEETYKEVPCDDKSIDVMYMGTIMCADHAHMIEVMKNYNYVHCSLNPGDLTQGGFHYSAPTHYKIPFKEKLSLLGKSKASVVMNLCPISEAHKFHIRQNKDWDKIRAFDDLDSNYIPQIKPRLFEAMAMKSVALVRWDRWNVVEDFFVPNEHFIYWNTFDELKEILDNMRDNPDIYNQIINNAYIRVHEFTIEKIIRRIIG